MIMLIIGPAIIGQNNLLQKNITISKSNDESLFIHLSNTTLIAGETLHCKFYCLNPSDNTFSLISKIAHVELLDSQNQNVLTNKIYLENGNGQGDFFIPTTVNTGTYKLIAYTNWMLNKKEHKISEVELVIINPYVIAKNSIVGKKNEPQKNDAQITESNSVNNAKNELFSLELNKKTASTRDQIQVKIKSLKALKSAGGSFSIAIKRADNLPSLKQKDAFEFAKSNVKSTLNDSLQFLPELRGELVSGTIINNKNPKEVAGKNIALSVPGIDFSFKIVKTDIRGKFNFILDKLPNYPNVAIQVLESNRADFNIEINKDKKYSLSEIKPLDDLNLTSDYKNSIEQRSVANQIENIYYTHKRDSIKAVKKAIPFYHPAEKEYVLADYTKFPTLKETVTEILKEVYYREDNNNFTLGVRDINYDLKFFAEPALVLVDGLLIQNTNELKDYKMENVYKISIVPGVYLYGPTAFNGIISFTTKNNDYESKEKGSYYLKTEIQRPQEKITYFKQDYTDKSKYDRIPDYRHLLLWEPDLKLENVENSISFFTSDVLGVYEIDLEGFTKDGSPVSLKETFEVKDLKTN
ncbi:hypothetical protein [Flavobacterium daemonense]|uniref:hypothetical protein n=1 Tax=Flavobacterium daemonense TaxID=1393049 RepID=UPI0011870EDA|nr:hypothetical protein [Flavobacterium daemonense]KAF2334420.1 hypothetical protein FND99_08955 [Flavobacterium daemonense]